MKPEMPSVPGFKGAPRPCPALHTSISPAECAARRNAEIECPPDCPFNPFGLHCTPPWKDFDSKWNEKAMEFVRQAMTPGAYALRLRRWIEPDCEENKHATHDEPIRFGGGICSSTQFLDGALLGERDSKGRTLWDSWEAAGWPGLTSDERTYSRLRRRIYASVFEVQERIDDEQVIAVDVLEPGTPPVRIVDKYVALNGSRFSLFSCIVVPFPTFVRAEWPSELIPRQFWPDWMTKVNRQVTRARGPRPGLTVKQWLFRNKSYADAWVALMETPRTRLLEKRKDQAKCVAAYSIKGSWQALDTAINARRGFRRADPVAEGDFEKPLALFHWVLPDYDPGEKDKHYKPSRRAGTIRIGEKNLIFDTLSRDAFDSGTTYLERYFGDKLEDLHEEVSRLRPRAGAPVPGKPDPEDPYACEAEMTDEVLEELTPAQFYDELMDTPMAALLGATPRQAAANPELRPRLVEVMKLNISELEMAVIDFPQWKVSINPWLDQLGLTELKSKQ